MLQGYVIPGQKLFRWKQQRSDPIQPLRKSNKECKEKGNRLRNVGFCLLILIHYKTIMKMQIKIVMVPGKANSDS